MIAKYGSDLLALIGLAMLGAGLWLFQPWVSLSVVGAILLGIGLISAYKR